MKTVAVVGSTGSIGTQTIDVVADAPNDYRIMSLAAGSSVELLTAQALAVQPDVVVIGDESRVRELRAGLPDHIKVEAGADAMAAVAAGGCNDKWRRRVCWPWRDLGLPRGGKALGLG